MLKIASTYRPSTLTCLRKDLLYLPRTRAYQITSVAALGKRFRAEPIWHFRFNRSNANWVSLNTKHDWPDPVYTPKRCHDARYRSHNSHLPVLLNPRKTLLKSRPGLLSSSKPKAFLLPSFSRSANLLAHTDSTWLDI